jgi:hypothetical protein
MKTNPELYNDITKMTMIIHSYFPELIKYITEIPTVTNVVTSPEIENKMLKDYFETLKNVLFKYAKSHNALITNF